MIIASATRQVERSQSLVSLWHKDDHGALSAASQLAAQRLRRVIASGCSLASHDNTVARVVTARSVVE